MDLRRIANTFETTSFDIFNESTQLWESDGMEGKIMPIDRFLSIFHRATRRRALGLAPGTVLPDSHTIRDPATGQAYIVGLIRTDSAKAVAYDSVGILHGVDSIGTISRKATVGPADDPGILASSDVGSHYMDMELRSSVEADERIDTFESHFFLTTPTQSDIQQWDFITYQGRIFQVQAAYNDSGMNMARVVEKDDPRVDVTFHKKGDTSDYNPITGVVTSGLVDYAVSGFFRGFAITEIDGSAVSSGDMQFIISQEHIGVVPTNQDELTYNGKRYNIKAVQQDFEREQYILHCVI